MVGQNHKEKHWRKVVQSRGRVGVPAKGLSLAEDMSPLSPGSQCPSLLLLLLEPVFSVP